MPSAFANSPFHGRFNRVVVEEATITGVNPGKYTINVYTRHSEKTVNNIRWLSVYHHFEGGEGITVIPEVGAQVLLLWPSDTTPPLVMGYLPIPNFVRPDGEQPPTQDLDTLEDTAEIGYRSGRPELQEGDIYLSTRDENFIALRRGGILQLGSSPICQRLFFPITNFIKDFCESYELATPTAEAQWLVLPTERDVTGKNPGTYRMQLREYAQDQQVSIRVRAMEPEADKTGWELVIAPQGINPDTGEVTNLIYKMQITMVGNQFEELKLNREVVVHGNDSLTVDGDKSDSVGGTYEITASSIKVNGPLVVSGSLQLGGSDAGSPAVLGDQLQLYLSSLAAAINGLGGPLIPPTPSMLSTKVRLS